MRIIIGLLMTFMLLGCETMGNAINNMSEREKQTAVIVGGLLITGAIIANQQDGDTFITNNCHGHGNQVPCD